MSSGVSPPGSVYTGLWTDWTHGRAQGLTLTVPSSHGAVLVAFLAIFVRIAGGHLWDIFCYAIFHVRSTEDARDGLHHQQQALLRNNLSDNRAIWQFSSIAWKWRGRTKAPLARTLPLILSAVFHFTAFTAAGIFSSKVTSISSTVLISGPTCGSWTIPDQNGIFNKTLFTESSQQASWVMSNFKNAADYAKSCYSFNNTGQPLPQHCLAYGRRLIPWSTNADVDCPFADSMCIDGLAVRLDSGYIDSHLHLGINSPPQDRISFRHVFECAPITTEGFVTANMSYSETGLPSSEYNPSYSSAKYAGYNYGMNNIWGINFTFIYDNSTFGNTFCDCLSPAYLISQAQPGTFRPIKALNRTDGDLWMFFIMNDRPLFADPVHDPVFKSDVLIPVIQSYVSDSGEAEEVNVTYFGPPAPVSVLGCVSQYQWCNANKVDGEEHNCTKISGAENQNLKDLGFTRQQEGLYRRLVTALSYSSIGLIASGLGQGALLAGTIASETQVSVPLPDDQWIREMDYWFGMHVTNLQLQTVQFSTGTGNDAWDRDWTAPTAADRWMCSNQMVQRNDYSSVNMLGVILILCFGVLFIAVNAFLDPIVGSLRSKKHKTRGITPWRMHHVLQLQSMLYEALGMGNWNREALVPVTLSREGFGLPNVEKLRERSTEMDSTVDRAGFWAPESDKCGEHSASVEGTYLLPTPSSDPFIWSNGIGTPSRDQDELRFRNQL